MLGPALSDTFAQQMTDETNMQMNETKLDVMMAPKKQMKQNIDPHNVVCKAGLELVLKASDFSPACVKPETAGKLKERGWASAHELNHDTMQMK